MGRLGLNVFLLVAVVTTACGELGATVEISSRNMADFFTRECLQQNAAEIARREWRRPFCLDECGSLDGGFRWEATGDDGSLILVELQWTPSLPGGGPPSGEINCSVSVATAHADALRAAVSVLQVDGLNLRSEPEALGPSLSAWRAPTARQLISIERHESLAEFDARRRNESLSGSWYRDDLVRRQPYPIELSVIYRD